MHVRLGFPLGISIRATVMSKKRRKNQDASSCAASLPEGQTTFRAFVPVIVCFIVAWFCSLGSTSTVRLVGSLFFAILFLLLDWHTWKTGTIWVNIRIIGLYGTIDRKERPVAFLVATILLLLFEVVFLLITVVVAMRAPGR